MLNGAAVMILQDLAPETLQRLRQLRNYTLKLHMAGYKYSGGFPFSLMVSNKGNTLVATSNYEAALILRELRLGALLDLRVIPVKWRDHPCLLPAQERSWGDPGI